MSSDGRIWLQKSIKMKAHFFASHRLELMFAIIFLALVLIALHLLFCLTHFLLEHVKEGALLQCRRHFALWKLLKNFNQTFCYTAKQVALLFRSRFASFSPVEREFLLFLLLSSCTPQNFGIFSSSSDIISIYFSTQKFEHNFAFWNDGNMLNTERLT